MATQGLKDVGALSLLSVCAPVGKLWNRRTAAGQQFAPIPILSHDIAGARHFLGNVAVAYLISLAWFCYLLLSRARDISLW